MPGFITHYLFGVHGFRRLPASRVRDAAAAHPQVYHLGQQGPDFFFFWLPSHLSSHPIGSVLHTSETGRFFRAMTEYALSRSDHRERQTALAYLAGFLGHYALDCTCHPYVYSRTGYDPDRGKSKGYLGVHVDLETDAGTLLLYRARHQSASSFCQAGPVRISRRERLILADMLRFSIRKGYGRLFPAPLLSSVLLSFPLCLSLLTDPSGRKRKYLTALELRILGFPFVSPQIPRDLKTDERDVLNLHQKPWRHPWKKELVLSDSFPDLLKQAGRTYRHMICALTDCLDTPGPKTRKALEQAIGNLSYHSGLPLS